MPKYDVICAYLDYTNVRQPGLSRINVDFAPVNYLVVLNLDTTTGAFVDSNTGVAYIFDGVHWVIYEPPVSNPLAVGFGGLFPIPTFPTFPTIASMFGGIDPPHPVSQPAAPAKPPVQYGATCCKCNGWSEHAEAVAGFTCYGCRS